VEKDCLGIDYAFTSCGMNSGSSCRTFVPLRIRPSAHLGSSSPYSLSETSYSSKYHPFPSHMISNFQISVMNVSKSGLSFFTSQFNCVSSSRVSSTFSVFGLGILMVVVFCYKVIRILTVFSRSVIVFKGFIYVH